MDSKTLYEHWVNACDLANNNYDYSAFCGFVNVIQSIKSCRILDVPFV